MAGCQLLREVTNLRNVDFQIDRVSDVRLAGIQLDQKQSYEDLNAREVLELSRGIARGELSFQGTIHVQASNPEQNPQARLMEMDWTLLLEDRETISGSFSDVTTIPSGASETVRVPVELDLLQFFGENLRDLIDMSLSAAGRGGDAKTIALEASPTIETRLGPIRYPEPITIVRQDVGQTAESASQ